MVRKPQVRCAGFGIRRRWSDSLPEGASVSRKPAVGMGSGVSRHPGGRTRERIGTAYHCQLLGLGMGREILEREGKHLRCRCGRSLWSYADRSELTRRIQMTNPIAVGIVMGSQSDWATMKNAADILDELEIPYETTIVSAHRTPERLRSYGMAAVARGLQVI